MFNLNSNTLINMRGIMSCTPGWDDNPIFFTMKRVQQCVWLLIHRCEVNYNILKLFKDIVIKGRRLIEDAAIEGCYIWIDAVSPEAIAEMDKALDRGLKKIKAKLSTGEKKEALWNSLWEFCNNAGKDESPFWYPTYVVIRTPAEYEAWLERVLVLVEEAFK